MQPAIGGDDYEYEGNCKDMDVDDEILKDEGNSIANYESVYQHSRRYHKISANTTSYLAVFFCVHTSTWQNAVDK